MGAIWRGSLSEGKPCAVQGCKEHIAPSMWHSHMTSHAKGIFPGDVPNTWLKTSLYLPSLFRVGYLVPSVLTQSEMCIIYIMDYASRLANLNLSSLEYRRVYFDLTMCYKIVNKLLDIDAAEMFTVSSNVHSTRGNSYRLQSITIPCHDFRLYFFTSRVVPIWNSLPQHVVSAKNIITFMSHLQTVDLSPFCKLYPFK